MKLEILDSMCDITKKAINDFNSMSDTDFLRKYSAHKITYYKRVIKYGDPYMNSPLVKIGKSLSKLMTIRKGRD